MNKGNLRHERRERETEKKLFVSRLADQKLHSSN